MLHIYDQGSETGRTASLWCHSRATAGADSSADPFDAPAHASSLDAHDYHEEDDQDGRDGQDDQDDQNGQDGQSGSRGASQLELPLHIAKNRSTGSLALAVDTPDKARYRLSFDAGAAAAEYDAVARSSLMTDHDHGLGPSGLRRIRQHVPLRTPTLPANSSHEPLSAGGLPRSVSMTLTQHPRLPPLPPLSAGPTPLAFTEDLNRFSAESLHSFSFAHLSEDMLHNRQNAIKRSVEFMKDRMGWASPSSPNAALASAQARASGDVDTQNTLELLNRAQILNASNLPSTDPARTAITGPLTGPPALSQGVNVFEKSFFPRSASPELMSATTAPSTALPSPALTRQASYMDDSVSPLHGSPTMGTASSSAILSSSATLSSSSSILTDGQPPVQDDSASTLLSPTSLRSATPVPISPNSAESSRTPTNESGTTQQTSPPASLTSSSISPTLRRSMTDIAPVAVQQKLMDTLAKPYVAPSAAEDVSGGGITRLARERIKHSSSPQVNLQPLSPISVPGNLSTAVHSHTSRWVPAAQAIFTTESKPPWTIIAANDLACLVFGVTRAEVRKMGILEVVQEERRAWLEKKLLHGDPDADDDDLGGTVAKNAAGGGGSEPTSAASTPTATKSTAATVTMSLLGSRASGITAKLLSKPSSRSQTPTSQGSRSPVLQRNAQKQLQDRKRQAQTTPARRANTIHSGDVKPAKPSGGGGHHQHTNSRGVLLCGDVVPIQKRNGATGSASLWVKEKRVGLIWVLEEIHEDVATVTLNEDGCVTSLSGALGPIWGDEALVPGMDIGKLVPRIPRQGIDLWSGPVDFAELVQRRYYTCRNSGRINIPSTIERISGQPTLRISSFPHIAGIIVVSTQTLAIKSSNSVFAGALFGYEKTHGYPITQLIPNFDKMLQILIDVDNVHLVDGMVVPEHSFRKALAFLALREGRVDAGTGFLRPEGLPARHRDGSELRIDLQMRVVKSEKAAKPKRTVIASQLHETAVEEEDEGVVMATPRSQNRSRSSSNGSNGSRGSNNTNNSCSSDSSTPQSEMVYALWITYSRHLHASRQNLGVASPLLSGLATPLHQPSPGQTPIHSPLPIMTPIPRERTLTAQVLTSELRSVAQAQAQAQAQTQLQETVTPSTVEKAWAAQSLTAETIRPQMALGLPLLPGREPAKAAASAAPVAMPDVRVMTSTPDTDGKSQSAAAAAAAAAVANATANATATVMHEEAPNEVDESGGTQETTESKSQALAVAKTNAPENALAKALSSYEKGKKKTINDFVIVEDMGQGAYGQVKLAKYKATGRKVVLKYVTKKRILVDTWTRDRRLGTVPLEIHVLDYLRRDGLRHPNIVEMDDFFEDDVNYYIEMVPHGLPGMDLFDYIELRSNMEEQECRGIFVQVAEAIHHLHTKAFVVHRDIKDENVVLDGDGHIRLIDFGSAAYIKSGPFDVFVGTIDYAAPEVLAGRPYGGKEQDVWALGILLYTIIYKENPFYSIDEIMDRDLRVPYTISDESIDLIRHMLNRDVAQRYNIDQVLAHPWCQIEL